VSPPRHQAPKGTFDVLPGEERARALIFDHGAEILVCLAPPWAELIAATYPSLDDVAAAFYEHAALPATWWPDAHQRRIEAAGRVDADGRVHLVESPEHLLVMVCGGLGSLHAMALHSFGPTRAVTRSF